jgi:hypothetical protein
LKTERGLGKLWEQGFIPYMGHMYIHKVINVSYMKYDRAKFKRERFSKRFWNLDPEI